MVLLYRLFYEHGLPYSCFRLLFIKIINLRLFVNTFIKYQLEYDQNIFYKNQWSQRNKKFKN